MRSEVEIMQHIKKSFEMAMSNSIGAQENTVVKLALIQMLGITNITIKEGKVFIEDVCVGTYEVKENGNIYFTSNTPVEYVSIDCAVRHV
jgi:hypothetical protein